MAKGDPLGAITTRRIRIVGWGIVAAVCVTAVAGSLLLRQASLETESMLLGERATAAQNALRDLDKGERAAMTAGAAWREAAGTGDPRAQWARAVAPWMQNHPLVAAVAIVGDAPEPLAMAFPDAARAAGIGQDSRWQTAQCGASIKTRPGALVVGASFLSSGGRYLPLARLVVGDGSQPAVTVCVLLDANAIESRFGYFKLRGTTRIDLVTSDGTVVLSSPPHGDERNVALTPAAIEAALVATARGEAAEVGDFLGDGPRMAAMLPLNALPLIVVSSTTSAEFVAFSDRSGRLIGILAAGICLIVGAASTVSRRLVERVERQLVDLKASEERARELASVVEAANNLVVITDAAGRIEWTNAAFERLTGYALSEVRGRKPGEFLQGPDTDREAVRVLAEAITERRPVHGVEILNYSKAGRPYWLDLSLLPHYDADGRLSRFVAIETEITESIRAKKELDRQARELRRTQELAALGGWSLDVRTDAVTWSDEFFRIIEADPAQGPSLETFDSRFSVEDLRKISEAVKRCVEDREGFDLTLPVSLPSGKAKWLRIIGDPRWDGNPHALDGAIIDVTAQEMQRQQLMRSEANLREAERMAGIFHWSYDPATHMVEWSENLFRTLGYEPFSVSPSVELYRQHLSQASIDTARSYRVDMLSDNAKDRYQMEHDVLRLDKTLIRVREEMLVQRDAENRIVRIHGYGRDITEERRREDVLRDKEARLAQVEEVAGVGYWEHDLVTDRRYWSPTFLRQLRLPPDTPPSREALMSVMHPDDRASFAMRNAEHNGETHIRRYRVRENENEVRTLISKSGQICDSAGRPVKRIGAVIDVTEFERAGRRLEAARLRLELATQVAGIGLWDLDPDSRLIRPDSQMRKLCGLSEDQLTISLEDWCSHFLMGPDRDTIRKDLEEVIGGNYRTERGAGEVPIRRTDGVERLFMIHWTYGERIASGRRIILGTVQDITDRRADEMVRIRMQRMDAIQHLAGGIAHDFNNLLSIIVGNLEFAEEKAPPQSASLPYIAAAMRSTRRASELTRKLLGLSRVNSDRQEICNLGDTIQEVKSVIERGVMPHIRLSIDAHSRLAARVPAGEFSDALINLIVNARDAMPTGGEIRLTATDIRLDSPLLVRTGRLEAGQYVCVSVHDSGTGMAPEIIDRIFEPFFSTKHSGKGSGFGLAMVLNLARRNGGAVDVESSPGEGSTFRLWLPAEPEAPGPVSRDEAAAPLPAPDGERRAGRRILVVDDEAELRELLGGALEKLGYECHLCANGSEALSVIEDGAAFDILLTDVIMPGLRGDDLIRSVRVRHPAMPVVVMTGFAGREGESTLPSDVNSVLYKPFSLDQLRGALQQIAG